MTAKSIHWVFDRFVNRGNPLQRLSHDFDGSRVHGYQVAFKATHSKEFAVSLGQPFVEAFVADCVASLREQTAQLCGEMLASINGCETGVHQKTLNRLVKWVDQFKTMNFMGDADMEQQLEHVKRELLSKTAEEYRDSAVARARLKNGLAQLANQARNLARLDATELVQRFGEMGKRKFNLAA
jgi:predicted oxidoreductase